MQFARPNRLEEALALLADGEWRILAGGTDFYPSLGDSAPNGKILDITALEDAHHIALVDGYWSIGALATWTDIIRAELPAAFDALKLAAREVGSVQIQNRATVAGNLCNASPAADGVPPLLTLDAEIEIASSSGLRREPLGKFIRGNRRTGLGIGEMVVRILVPEKSAAGASSFLKLGARKYLVISITMVAARMAVNEAGYIEDAAVSVGACSAVAKRLPDLEAALVGENPNADLDKTVSAKHLSGLSPIDDVRAPANYRLDASLELVRRTVRQAAGGAI
ncbi:MAG: FAD binding domain-containing protein [Hyphomicrobiales bacterium]